MKIPKNEKLWVQISDGTNVTHIITSRWPFRDLYYLYAVLPDDTLKKIGSDRNPHDLEEKYLRKETS